MYHFPLHKQTHTKSIMGCLLKMNELVKRSVDPDQLICYNGVARMLKKIPTSKGDY